VNRLPAVGLIDFSVGAGAGAGAGAGGGAGDACGDVVAGAVVAGALVSGAGLPPPQAAVNPTIVMIAPAPAAAKRRRPKRLDLMMLSLSVVCEIPVRDGELVIGEAMRSCVQAVPRTGPLEVNYIVQKHAWSMRRVDS
jgi:hypothetical protein